jgi:hypothetical protein
MSRITTSVGSPGTVGSASGGRTYSFNNISTVPQQIVGGNPQRQRITIHNPGTVDVFVAPASVIINGSDVALVPSNAALGGCFRVYANGGSLTIDGECQKPWQAFAASGSTNPLTVMDSNV